MPRSVAAEVTYPAEAIGDAEVILELVIDATGRVSEVSVVRGPEPFASSAEAAARNFVFEPATQDGRPIASKIRFVVQFVAPVPPEEDSELDEAGEPAAEVPTAEPAPPPTAAPPAYTVVVRGERPSPGSVTFSVAEARGLPGAFGDPFRSIETLPGVTPIISGVPFFFVRGAPPGNLGFFLDGVPVPLLYHAFIGPAVVHPMLIDRVEIHRGGYPARYGRYAGGIVAAETRGPPASLDGHASLRLVDAGAYVAAPFDEHRGHASVSGRYSYTAFVLSLLTDAVLDYWDYQGRVSYDLTPRDTVSVFAFGAYDFLGNDAGLAEEPVTMVPGQPDDERRNFAGTEFHRIDLRYDRKLGSGTSARVAVTGGIDRSRATNGGVFDRSVRLRTELVHTASDSLELRAGADAMIDHFELEIDRRLVVARDIEALFPARNDYAVGSYLETTWSPTPRVTVEPGIRVDLYESMGNTEVGVDPRISARFSVHDDVRLVHAFGVAHQTPNFVPSLPGARVGGLRGGLQRSVQYSSGVEVDLARETTATASLFQSLFFNLSDPLGFSRTLSADVDASNVRALGYAYGAELMIQRSLTRSLGGYLSYTLSRSVRKNGRLDSLSAFDRTHVASMALAYDLGKRWRIGGRGAFSTGVPTRRLTVEGPEFHGGNRPAPFFRLDLRAEKRWLLGEHAWWAIVAEVLNATGSQEIVGRSCNPTRCTDSVVGPLVLPSLGVEIGF